VIFMFALVFGSATASKKTLSIEPGMTKDQVVKVLGKPADRFFQRR